MTLQIIVVRCGTTGKKLNQILVQLINTVLPWLKTRISSLN
ncbi:hypothetical protein Hanom_Chr01g00012301 [Helianthus anomalus]